MDAEVDARPRPLTDAQLDRYARHILLREIGGAGQRRLLDAKVLVIGAGGLGSPALLYLAAAGVGRLGVVDDDAVALSNLQRQILFRDADVGRPKVEVAAREIPALNPDVRIDAHATRLTAGNAAGLVADYDLVLDGCDNFETRLAVSDACVAAGKTLVSAAVGEFDGQIATFKPHVRGPGGERGPCYRCLVPEPPPDGGRRCTEMGVAGALTGVIGAWAALEAIKEIAGFGESLAGRLLLFDGLRGETRRVRLAADPACPACGPRAP